LDETNQTDPNPSPEDLAAYHDLWERGADVIVRQFLDLFASVADRDELLAWQMVCLDGIPQKDVAGLLQCHPSTISRYRERVEKKVQEAFANNDRLRALVDALTTAPRTIVCTIAERVVEQLRQEYVRSRASVLPAEPDKSEGMDSALKRKPKST
jgi:hypothetical protein